MSDPQGFKFGAFVAPLTAETTNGLLADADPALAGALAFYAEVLTVHLGARWDAEVTAANLPALVGKLTALAIPYDPLPYLTQAQLQPPYLALYVVSERSHEHTRNWQRTEADWRLTLVLPPLTPAQHLRLAPILRAAAKVIVDRTEQGYDPSVNGGALAWNAAGIDEIVVTEARYGTIQALKSELFFPAVEIDLTVCEQKYPTPGLKTITGLDGTVQSAGPSGTNALPIADFQEDLT